jgi:hypothetical protein
MFLFAALDVAVGWVICGFIYGLLDDLLGGNLARLVAVSIACGALGAYCTPWLKDWLKDWAERG